MSRIQGLLEPIKGFCRERHSNIAEGPCWTVSPATMPIPPSQKSETCFRNSSGEKGKQGSDILSAPSSNSLPTAQRPASVPCAAHWEKSTSPPQPQREWHPFPPTASQQTAEEMRSGWYLGRPICSPIGCDFHNFTRASDSQEWLALLRSWQTPLAYGKCWRLSDLINSHPLPRLECKPVNRQCWVKQEDRPGTELKTYFPPPEQPKPNGPAQSRLPSCQDTARRYLRSISRMCRDIRLSRFPSPWKKLHYPTQWPGNKALPG